MNKLVLTNKFWGIRNTELIYDYLFFFGLIILSISSLIGTPLSFLYIFIGLIVISGIVLIILRKRNHYIYILGSLSQVMFFFVLIPVEWMNPIWVISLFTFGLIIIYFLRTKRFYFPIFILPLAFLYLVTSFLPVSGFLLSEVEFKWIDTTGAIAQDSIGIMGSNRIGIFESLSFFAFSGIALTVFRRPIVIPAMIWIFLITYFFFQPEGFDLNLKSALVSGTIFTLAVLAPGSNRYGAFWMNQLVFIILIGMVIVLKNWTHFQYPFFLVIFSYFVLDGLFLKYIVDTGLKK